MLFYMYEKIIFIKIKVIVCFSTNLFRFHLTKTLMLNLKISDEYKKQIK